MFYQLLGRCREVAAPHGLRFKNKLPNLDATLIELCASVFDWAQYRRNKDAVKLHLLLDHQGLLPSFALVTEGRVHESRVAGRCAPSPAPSWCLIAASPTTPGSHTGTLDSSGDIRDIPEYQDSLRLIRMTVTEEIAAGILGTLSSTWFGNRTLELFGMLLGRDGGLTSTAVASILPNFERFRLGVADLQNFLSAKPWIDHKAAS